MVLDGRSFSSPLFLVEGQVAMNLPRLRFGGPFVATQY
jgi:hypothetical protein